MADSNTAGTTEDFEAMLPEGWTGGEGADIFDPRTWGASGSADAQGSGDPGDGETSDKDDADSCPTTDESGENTAGETTEDGPTTAGKTVAPEKIRFKVSIDHTDKDVELDPTELPTIYQKASVLERYQRRLNDAETERSALKDELDEWEAIATGLKYADRKELQKSVIDNAVASYIEEHPNVPEEMARDYITRQFRGAKPEKKEKPGADGAKEAVAPGQTATPQRDFKSEVAALMAAFPQARGQKLPEEVVQAVARDNKPLVQAYAEYAAKKAEADARETKKENKILKQNQAAAAKAPVSKVTGGGKTDTDPEDDFLRGFNADAW